MVVGVNTTGTEELLEQKRERNIQKKFENIGDFDDQKVWWELWKLEDDLALGE